VSRAGRDHTDPRRPGGAIAGPGGPRDRNSVVIDATDAVLLADVGVAMIEPYRDGQPMAPAYALTLSGRINKTEEHSSVLYLMDAQGAAAVCAEIIALAGRMGQSQRYGFAAAFDAALAKLTADGALPSTATQDEEVIRDG
jgi:hypothetical protein